jgi:hypothetical protein
MKTNKYLNNNVFELRLPHPVKYKGVMELKEEDVRLGGDMTWSSIFVHPVKQLFSFH